MVEKEDTPALDQISRSHPVWRNFLQVLLVEGKRIKGSTAS